jgi:ribosome-associated protein
MMTLHETQSFHTMFSSRNKHRRAAFRRPSRRVPTHQRASKKGFSSNQKNQQDMIDFIDQPMESMVGDSPLAADNDEDLMSFVKCIVKAADGRKADEIVALEVGHVSTLASVLVVLSGNSRPQNQAIAAAITKDVQAEYGMRPGGTGVPEGNAESGWMLLDYGSVMVHIMTPKSRLYYNVEGQWRGKGGRDLDVSDVLIPNKMEVQEQQSEDFVAQEDDPFWS